MTDHQLPPTSESNADEFRESAGPEPTYLPRFTGESFSSIPHAQPEPDRTKPWGFILLGLVALIIFVSNVEPFESRATRLGNYVSGASNNLPTVEPTGLIYCEEIDSGDKRAIELAAHEMQGTAEGGRLFRQLIYEQICIGVEKMEYAGAYTSIRQISLDWYHIEIMINPELIDTFAADELAAILIHEATHADRALHETSCTQTRDCELLPNGVEVEEEVAAHAAEAEFWIELHGPDGTATGITFTGSEGAVYLNDLVERYNRGPQKFRQYVRYMRSDPRESEMSLTPTP